MIEIFENRESYYPRFEAFPVFELFLAYAIRDLQPRVFVDSIPSPQCLVLASPPAFFILGEPDMRWTADVLALFHRDAWVLSASPAWGPLILNAFPNAVDIHKRTRFASDHLRLDHILASRRPLPEGLSIVPIDDRLANTGIIYDDVVSRFFTKSAFPDHGFGFALVDSDGEALGFAMTNYPIVANHVELYFRVGYDFSPAYRGKGYGMQLCGYFIEAALKRGLVPVWDSANAISAHIASKLGYVVEKEWEMYHILEIASN